MDYPKRKYPRLKQYDYRLPGFYYVTIQTATPSIRLSTITPPLENLLPGVILTAMGEVVQQQLLVLPQRYPCVIIDKYVIMPTHIHLILQLLPQNEAPVTLMQVIGAYKSITTRLCNQRFDLPNRKLFQTSFYESVLRNERAYQECWQYIEANPSKWYLMNKT